MQLNNDRCPLSDFRRLRNEIISSFSPITEILAKGPSKDYTDLACHLGHFLKWHGPVIDFYASQKKIIFEPPRLFPGVEAFGDHLRRSAVDVMEGRGVKYSAQSMAGLHEKFDRLEKMLAGAQGGEK